MTRYTSLAVCILVLTSTVCADDWNQWRGPQRTGVVNIDLPDAWPEKLTKKWSLEVGTGHSSPLVVDGIVYLNSRIDEMETVTAFDLESGATIWRDAYAASYDMPGAAASHGQGPKSTPLHDGERLYTFGISGVLSAYDAKTGKVLWRHDFVGDYPIPYPLFGTALSPIIVDGRLIAHVGGKDGGALAAFDPESGKRIWAWSGDGPSYASPVVATIGGAKQLVTQSEHAFVGIDPQNGGLLWKTPYTTPYDQNIVTTVVDREWLITSGLDQGMGAYHPKRSDDGWELAQVWHTQDVGLYMSSPVLYKGNLFGFSHLKRGQFFRANADDGRVTWLSDGRQGENAFVVAADGHLLWLTTRGKLSVTRADADTFDPIAEYTVSSTPVWAHLTAIDNGLLIKDATTLTYWTLTE